MSTDPLPPESQNPALALGRMADALSLSLLFSLGRQYLELPLADAPYLQPFASANPTEAPHLLRVEQVGESLGSALGQPFTALQNALSACHDPGRYTLLFVAASDGRENRIYLGVRGQTPSVQPYNFLDYLGRFLEGNWPGTRLTPCDYQRETQPRILLPLSRDMRHGIALTGIPALKPGDHPGYPQSLDRLLRGLSGRPFIYVIVAEPLPVDMVNDVILRCRGLIGRVQGLIKTNLTETLTRQYSEAVSKTDTKSHSVAKQTSEGESKTRGWGLNLQRGLGVLASVFPPAALLAMVGPSFNSSKTRTRSTATTLTDSISEAFGQTVAQSQSEAQAVGREYFNAHAQAAEQLLERYVARFEQARTSGCWNVGAYFLAADRETALQGGAQLRALLSGEKSIYEPIRIHDLNSAWAAGAQAALGDLEQPLFRLVNPDQPQETVTHPLGPLFGGLTTPLNTEELALLANLPRREVPGVRQALSAGFSLNPPPAGKDSIRLGHVLEGGKPTALTYPVPLQSLAKHALITGITGSGKSTTCLRLLHELQQQRTPFLVIEPAKDEYVAWALQRNKNVPPDQRIRVYIPGVTAWRGQMLEHTLRLNPLDVVWLDEKHPPPVLSHVDRLKSILNATFPMQEALPILLEEVLFAVYGKPVNWLGDELPPFGSPRPTLRQMYDSVRDVVKQKGYEERVTANLTAALMTRLNSLRRGWKGRLFDRPDSAPWPEIFDQPAVINLAQLGDDADRAFAMAVLLQFLYEYRQAQAERAAATDSRLRHLTVVEEAHRVLLRTAGGGLEQANPQGKVAEMFSNILSEIRAYGEGLLIVDQVPARLIPDAIKNTNLKIVHRLVASDDREAMGGCMTLTPDQTALINRLRAGQAIVYGDQDDMAAWVQVARDSAT